MRKLGLLGMPLALVLLLGACETQSRRALDDACLNGRSSCAAAEAPEGMRRVLKGYRMVKTEWVQKTNKESGVPDIGVKAEWAPVTERH